MRLILSHIIIYDSYASQIGKSNIDGQSGPFIVVMTGTITFVHLDFSIFSVISRIFWNYVWYRCTCVRRLWSTISGLLTISVRRRIRKWYWWWQWKYWRTNSLGNTISVILIQCNQVVKQLRGIESLESDMKGDIKKQLHKTTPPTIFLVSSCIWNFFLYNLSKFALDVWIMNWYWYYYLD